MALQLADLPGFDKLDNSMSVLIARHHASVERTPKNSNLFGVNILGNMFWKQEIQATEKADATCSVG